MKWDECRAWGDGKDLGQIPSNAVVAALAGASNKWETPRLGGEFRYFRIVFNQPVEIGTIVTDFADGDRRVALLRPDATGDLTNESHWVTLPGGPVKTLAPGTRVRALRFTHQVSVVPWDVGHRASRLPQVQLLKDRYWNPAQAGTAAWSKRDKTELWLAHWPTPLTIAAVVSVPANQAGLLALPADVTAHPTTVPANQWKPFVAGMTTRALQLTGTARPVIAPLVKLGPDEEPPRSFLTASPYRIQLPMPLAGFLAMRIADHTGKPIRRLVAEVPRSAGALREPWDLKNDAGVYVTPGTYTYHALSRPPLRLTYEGTVYNAGNPPWYAPVTGGGGWLSDHNPPRAICAVGDKLFLGGVGAEAGRGLAALDLEGRKIWDGGHLEPLRLASDGRYAYIVNNNEITRIDPANGYARTNVFKFQYSDKLPGHATDWVVTDSSGVACHNGRMYIAYNRSPAPWIQSAIPGGAIDPKQSFPPVGNERTHDTDFNPSDRIRSAFQALPSSTATYFGDAASSGSMKNMLVLALTREVALGSVLLPAGAVQAYALKPGKKLAVAMQKLEGEKLDFGGLEDIAELGGGLDPEMWQPLAVEYNLAVLPAGAMTRAILFKGVKRLDYALALDRRYKNAVASAKLVALEGTTTKAGSWKLTRTADKPISPTQPAVAALVWPEPTPVRGVAILQPLPWAGYDIDVWTGPGPADLQTNANWRTVHQHRQNTSDIKLRWHTARVIHADFGDTLTVSALRIRITVAPQPPDRKTPSDSGFAGVVAFQPIGGDVTFPPDMSQRITELDLATKALKHSAVAKPTALAFDTNGVMFVACADGIVRFGEPGVFIPAGKVKKPRQMLFDAEGLLYVLDGDSRQVIVFDSTSKEVRRIGKPGGAPLGPWDPHRLADPSAMTLDSAGKLWVVDQFFQPKRTARFTREGVHEKDLFGPTHYGGGGKMDAGDPTVINHLGMKFRVDYTNQTYRLEARLHPYSSPASCPDRVTYWKGHRYLVGDGAVVTPFGDAGPIAGIYVETNGVAAPLVQVGLLKDLPVTIGNHDPTTTSFLWSDLNRDRKPQSDEVQIVPSAVFRQCLGIGEDLSLNFPGYRLRPRGDLPTYNVADLEAVPELNAPVQVNARGETLVMGYKFLDAAGKVQWTYPDRYRGVQASMKMPWGMYGRPPGEIAGTGWWLGQLEVGGEELFCVNANQGDYYAITRDGLLAAAILGGPRGYGKRFFSMPECEWGKTDLTDLRATVEDFHGHVTRAANGKVYAIAGKTHITAIRVDGLEKMQRQTGTFTVTAADVRQVMDWAAERAGQEMAMLPPRIFAAPFLRKPPKIDGDVGVDWPVGQEISIRILLDDNGKVSEAHRARVGFDAENLYLFARSSSSAPARNTGTDKTRIFQFGDGFDLNLGLPEGDVRVVISQVAGKPVVMLYRFNVKGALRGGAPVDFSSPVGEIHIDEVAEVKTAKVAFTHDGQAWAMEAAIPWAALGTKAPADKTTLRGDVGILVADQNGVSTVERFYWANTSLVIMSDLPAEARIHPELWGTFQFNLPDVGDLIEMPGLPELDLGL